jgi:hypothetical protein
MCIWTYYAANHFGYYFANYRHESAAPFQYGFEKVVNWATAQSKPTILDMGEHSGLMAYLFTTHYPPADFQKQSTHLYATQIFPNVHVQQFGNIYITNPGGRSWTDYPLKNANLAIYSKQNNADKLAGRTGELLYPDGTPAFYYYSKP